MAYAQNDNRRVCTLNAKDFRKLAEAEINEHSGVIAVAGGIGLSGQLDMTMAAINWVTTGSNSGQGFLNRYIEVDENGEMIFASIHYGT